MTCFHDKKNDDQPDFYAYCHIMQCHVPLFTNGLVQTPVGNVRVVYQLCLHCEPWQFFLKCPFHILQHVLLLFDVKQNKEAFICDEHL